MKIVYLFLIFPIFLFGQTFQSIQPLEGRGGAEYGIYYKDLNNILDSFEGAYEFSGNAFNFRIILKKKILSNANNYYWQDMLVGGFKYTNASMGIDTDYLDEADIGLTLLDGRSNLLTASAVRPPQPPYCQDCLPEKWLIATISDPATHKSASLYIAKKIQNGEQGLQVWFRLEAASKQPWESDEPIQLPIGEFFMRKL